MSTSSIEKKIRAATHDDGWKPNERTLMELAQATHSYKNLPVIMGVIWKRLGDHTKNWKRTYKALLILDYLLKHGSDQVKHEVQVRRIEIQTLTMFQHGGVFDGKDIGLHLRDKAKAILEFLDSAEEAKSKPPPVAAHSPASDFRSVHQANSPQVYAQPIPVSAQPIPVAAKPIPVSAQPIPVAAQPVPGYGPAPVLPAKPLPNPGSYGAPPPLPAKNTAPSAYHSTPDPFLSNNPNDDPFAGSGSGSGSRDPFAAPPQGHDPFAVPPQGHDPFAVPPQGHDPFRNPFAQNDPFSPTKY